MAQCRRDQSGPTCKVKISNMWKSTGGHRWVIWKNLMHTRRQFKRVERIQNVPLCKLNNEFYLLQCVECWRTDFCNFYEQEDDNTRIDQAQNTLILSSFQIFCCDCLWSAWKREHKSNGISYITCTTAPQPLRASLSTAESKHWEMTSNKSSASCYELEWKKIFCTKSGLYKDSQIPKRPSADDPVNTKSVANNGAPIRSIPEMTGLFSGPSNPHTIGSV